MRKEIIFVTIASILFGAIIAFGVWRANSALRDDGNDFSFSSNQDDMGDDHSEDAIRLAIAEPSQDDVIIESPLIISGITIANSWVVITTADDDYIIQSDNTGLFETEIDLTGGINQITTTVFDEDGNSINETLRIVYSTEFADVINKPADN